MQADKQFINVSGRLVQGNVFEPQTTDMHGKPLTDLAGNPKVQYFIGVAVAKDAADFAAAWASIGAVAVGDWPTGESQRPDFSWKVIDGDDPKHAGKDGFAGHWIFRFTSGFPWQAVAQGATRPIVNPEEIKRGYFVRVFFTVAGNKSVQKPGVYLNASVVELIGYGDVITSGPDAAALVSTVGAAQVAGMQASPVAAPAVVAPVAAPVAPAVAAPVAAPVAPVAPAVAAPVAAPAVVAPVAAPVAPVAPAPVIAPNPTILNPVT